MASSLIKLLLGQKWYTSALCWVKNLAWILESILRNFPEILLGNKIFKVNKNGVSILKKTIEPKVGNFYFDLGPKVCWLFSRIPL